MTVAAVLAALGAIAVGSYRRYLLRTNRTDAMATLLQIQAAQEKYFLQNNSYVTAVEQIAAAPPKGLGIALGSGHVSPGGFYTIALHSDSPTSFKVTATTTGGQMEDKNCPAFSVDQSGTREPGNTAHCWR